MEASVRWAREEPFPSPQSSPRTPETIQTPHVEAAQAIQRLIYVRDEVAPARERLISARRTNEALGEVSRRRPRPASASEVRQPPNASMGAFAAPYMPNSAEQDGFRPKAIYSSPSSAGGRMGRGHMRAMPTLGAKRLAKELSLNSTGSGRRELEPEPKEPEKTQEQRVEFVKALRIRVAQEKLAESQRREEQAQRWRQHQDEVEREEQASGERSYKQTWLLDGDIKSKFSYAAHRELMADDNGAGEIEEYIEEMPPATEPVKRLGDIVKVEEIPRPGSSASTAFDSRPGSAVRPGSAMSWETGRPQSARRPYPPLSRPTSAVVRPSRPSSARPQSTLPAVSPSVTSEDTGTRSSQDPRPYQREEPTGDTLNDLEQEVAKINAAQPRSSPSHPRDGRPRRTSRTSVNSTLSDHYEYEGRDIAAGSPNLSEAGNEPDSRPVGPLARVLSDMEEDREGEVVEEPPAEQQAAKLGEFSIITIRRLFDELDTERKGFVTRRELLFALNSREDLYQQFCYFYLRSAEQEGPEDLDRLQAADLPVVDDWLSAHRAANIQRTEWETQAHSYVFEEAPTKQVRGRKSLIFRRSLEFLDEAYKQVCLLRAPTQVGSSQRLYQKCYNITLEILIHYFRMQGLLLEYQTAPILNLLPEDRTVWVDQVPPVFQALQASRGGATTAEVLGEFSSEENNKARIFIMAKGAVVDGEDPDLDQVKEGSLVRVEKVLEVAPNQINALLGNQQVSLFLASPSASRFEEGDEEEDDALSPRAPPLSEDLEPGSEAVPEPGENGSPELPEVLAAEEKEETQPLKEAVVLPLPTIEIQPEPVSPTSEVPARSEAATSEAKPHLEKPSVYYAGIVTPSSRSRSEGEMTPIKRMKPKSQVQYHPLRHDGTDGPREEFQPLVQTVQDVAGDEDRHDTGDQPEPGMPSEAEAPMEDAAPAALPPEVAEGEPEADRGEEDADAKSITSASFELGIVYVLRHPAFVSPRADVFEPDDDELIAELEEGEEIELVEIVGFSEEGRVRGKLKSPEGWITLRNSATGTNWVAGYSDRGASDQVSQESGQVSQEGKSDASVSEDPTAPYKKGVYILVRAAYVAHDADNFAPDDDELVARVEEGEEVEVVEVVDFVEEDRVRGRILEPGGWITLLNRITGTEWITPKDPGDHGIPGDRDESSSEGEEGDGPSRHEGKEEADTNPVDRMNLEEEDASRRKASELEQEEPYESGIYLLVRSAFVAYDADNFTPDDDELVAELEEGEEVEVVEVIDFVEDDRVRGRLRDPDGWITLVNRATGAKWVTPKESGNDFRGASKTAASEPGEQEEGSHSEDEDGKEPSRHRRVADDEDESPAMKWTSPEDAASIDAEAEGGRKASGSQGEDEDPAPFEPGSYILLRTAFVALDADNFSPDDEELVAELEEGEEVEIVEVVDFVKEERVRGRIRDLHGWITLLNRATGTEWVAPTTQLPSSKDTVGNHARGTGEEEASHSQEEDPPVRFKPGFYTLLRPTFVALDADDFSPDDADLVAKLPEGMEVEIVEVVDFVKEERVRGRIRDLHGWITLLNRATGTEWVAPTTQVPSSKDTVGNDARGTGEEEASHSQEEDPPVRFKPGFYTLLRPTFVALDADDFSPDDADLVAKLPEGMEVEIVEVVDFVKEERVRGRIRDLHGWITLLNRATGTEWVSPTSPAQESVDDNSQGDSQKDASSDVEATSEHSRPPTVVDDGVDATPGSEMEGSLQDGASVGAEDAGDREASHSEEEDSSVQFKKGSYVLLRPAFVALHADDFSPDDDDLVAELEEGMEVEIVEVVDFVKEERVRGRIRDLHGWITLLNRATGTEWVAPTTHVPLRKDSVDNDAGGQELGPELSEAEIARESSVEPEEPSEPPAQGSPTMLPGLYILLRPAFVSPEAKIFAPEDDELIAELEEGQEIEVTEIIDFESEKRLRGKLKDPDGWITLMSKATGAKWVSAKVLPEDAEYTGDGEASEAGEDRTPLSRRVSFHEADEESEPADGDSDPEDQGDMEAEEGAGAEPAEPGPKGRRKLFDVGLYVLRRPAFVSPRAELFEPDDDELVAELEEGEEIEIVEVVDFRNLGRVRGKLKSPEGWITLRNSATGIKWVAPKDESTGDQQAHDLEQDPPPYPKGFYILVRSAYVAYDADNFAPDDDELVAELEEGDEVEIVEVVDFVEEERVRGRLYDPDGWITLLNRATGAEWVTPKVEADAGTRGESDDDYSYSEDEDGNPRPRRQRMAYDVGEYILLRPAFVARDAKTFDPDDDEVVEELEEGQEVRAVEIVELKEEKRVRARLHQPDGWVTFANTATGVRRVVAKEEWLETRTAESWASGDVGGEDEEESDSASESERSEEDSRQARRVVHRNSGDMIPSFADVGTVHTDGDLLSRSNQGELAPTPKFKQLYPDGRQDSRKTQSEADEQTDDEDPFEDEPE